MADMPVADKLCNASAKGNLPEVLSLLRNGTDVNGFNKYNTTALQVAKLGNPALICELLLAGADPNLRDPACGLTVTHDAAREGFADSVRVLVEHGADVNIVDGHGNLPLHLAAREGHLEAMRLLLEQALHGCITRRTNHFVVSCTGLRQLSAAEHSPLAEACSVQRQAGSGSGYDTIQYPP
uniref:Uncharacterized protein n=1 Tax=Mola mola TaxID=94237 RepID=A0A3Q3XJE4_MOLML